MTVGPKKSKMGGGKGLVGLESVTYGVEDVAESIGFYEDFGLRTIDRGRHGATFATGEETTVEIRSKQDASLPQAMEPGSTVREICWGLDSQDSLDRLTADLETDRPVARGSGGTIHTLDPAGYGIAFRVTRSKPVTLKPQTLNTLGDAIRRNARARFYDRARPQHMGHVVLYCTNYEDQFDFYTRRLGFMVSDYVHGLGAFMRCSTDHHNLFLIKHRRTGLNHISFAVQDLDEIMGGFSLLSKKGWEPVWGLGRHYIGSNLFYYFRCPCGGYVEYYADMDCITDPEKWEPGEFDASSPEAMFAWGGHPPDDFGK